MHLGFTGTRKGMTSAQLYEVGQILRDATYEAFHHGVCVGADSQAALLAHVSRILLVAHPPTVDTHVCKHALEASTFVKPPLPYLLRNHGIVDASGRMLAAPDGPERTRSGTWATVRYAVKTSTPVRIVYPDGRIEVRAPSVVEKKCRSCGETLLFTGDCPNFCALS